MKKEQLLILATLSISLTFLFVVYFGNNSKAQAEINPNDRFFQKDFCNSELTLLNGINYSNGEDLSYDSSGCPVSMKVIHRWSELSTSNQIIINSRMATNGYSDVTNQVQQALR